MRSQPMAEVCDTLAPVSLRIFKTVRRWRFLDEFIEAGLATVLLLSPVILTALTPGRANNSISRPSRSRVLR
ncbi:MAG: hypothetical protein JRH11_04500 [Deltaproteobacteria bacterium]|nr:hypothetical protein [Deltaproteobacteria bacterium]